MLSQQLVNGNVIAGHDIHLVNSVTINNSESSILTSLKNLLNPVTSAAYDSYEAKQRSECFLNTRVQVLNVIETWIHDSDEAQIYVLDGVAGIGKSTIAQTVATRAAAQGLLGASFFFSRDEDLRRIARHFFPTIAYQLCRYDHQIAICIRDSLDQDPDAPAKRLYQQMLLLLIGPLRGVIQQRARPTLIVMDALDECEEENAEELLLLLGQYAQQIKGLKIFITMRPEAHLRGVLDQDQNHERFRLHEVEDTIVQSDIRLYIESKLSLEEICKVSRNRRAPWRPLPKDIAMLCGICGTLFIIAATATKFILDRKRLDPEKQLARLLEGVSASGFTGSKYTNVLDDTYFRIIFAAQPDPDEIDQDWFRDLNKILGALITLVNPLPYKALAALLDIDPDDIEATLSQLHSLVAPTGSSQESMSFRIHHKSFPDFITNRERIQHVLKTTKSTISPGLDLLLWVNMVDQHLRLAKACFTIMECGLRWNMADITKADWHKDKDAIPHVVPQLISRELAYATLNWVSHLRAAHGLGTDSELQEYLSTWVSRHILAWMEVLVIIDKVDRIYTILQDAIEILNCIGDITWAERDRTLGLLSDASRFVQYGHEVMRLSPIQIYRSCLPFTPVETPFYEAYHKMAMLKVGLTMRYHWSPLLATLIGHSGPIFSMAIAICGSQLASGSSDRTIRVWDIKTGAHISTLTGHSSMVMLIALSSEGCRLAFVLHEKSTIQIWDTKTGAHMLTLCGHSQPINSITFSNDDFQLASGSDDNTVQTWDVRTGANIHTLTGHSHEVCSVAFSADSFQLASGSIDMTIKAWNVETGAHIRTLTGHSTGVSCVAFSGDGSLLASGSWDQTIRLWDANTGVHVFTLSGHLSSVHSVAFSTDSAQLASGSDDNTIRVWNVKTGAHIYTLTDHTSDVISVAFSPDGSRLVSGSHDETIRFWDAKINANNSAHMGHSGQVTSIAFSAEGSRLASGSHDGTIRLWDTDAEIYISTLNGHSNWVLCVAFSGDGSQVASGSIDDTVRVWDAKTYTCIYALDGHSSFVSSVAFSSDCSRLASGSKDKTIQLWDAKTGGHISTLSGHSGLVSSIAFSKDGSRMASGSTDSTIRLWDATTGAHISTLPDHVFGLAFSGNGTQLASIGRDRTIRFWDARTSMRLCAIDAPSDLSSIDSLIFLQHGSQLVDHILLQRDQIPPNSTTDPVYLLLLVKREDPYITGLMLVEVLPETEDGSKGEFIPVCWFPPDMKVSTVAVNGSESKVAVGCENGLVMLLDIPSNFSLL